MSDERNKKKTLSIFIYTSIAIMEIVFKHFNSKISYTFTELSIRYATHGHAHNWQQIVTMVPENHCNFKYFNNQCWIDSIKLKADSYGNSFEKYCMYLAIGSVAYMQIPVSN